MALSERVVRGAGVDLALVEAGAPEAPAVVLIHGYPDDKQLWMPVMERLADRFHVIAYDVRGAGGSGAPRNPLAYSFEHLAGDLAAVLDDVSPSAPVHLVGHDWGSLAGWEFTVMPRVQRRIASYTAIAGPAVGHVNHALMATLRTRGPLPVLAALRHSWYIIPLLTPGLPTLFWRGLLRGRAWEAILEYAERLPPDPPEYRRTRIRNGIKGSNLYRRNILLGRRRPPPRPSMPVQVITPTGDRYLPELYYASVPRFVASLRRRRVAGPHFAPRTQPELVSRWVGEMVEDVERGEFSAGPSLWRRGGGVEQLQGALALVTGAGSGIGRATAHALSRAGARLVLVDLDEAAARRVAEELGQAAALACDVADAQAMERLRDQVVADHGVPDVVVNNAGIAVAGPFLQTGDEDWRRLLDVNLMGVVNGCRLFGEAMVGRGAGGHIVNTASAAAFWPSKDLPAYAASKSAVLMLSECLRAELGPSGVGVTAICPGVVATNITSAARYVGRKSEEQERMRQLVTKLYARRNFTADRVAEDVISAIAEDRAVVPITPEAKLMRLLSRLSPGATRRLAGVDALPV